MSANEIAAAVIAERQRCYDLAIEAPFRARSRAGVKEICFDITQRIRDGEAPLLLKPVEAPKEIAA